MNLHGEFLQGDGLVIPNNVALAGARAILGMALRGGTCVMSVGLCSGVYTPGLLITDLVEPTVTNGYARIGLNRNTTDWPTEGSVNGERYVESKALVWTASGGNFSSPITRMFLIFTSADFPAGIFALSSALPLPLLITPTTPVDDRTFRYRLYLR